jgi:hypothetical protein
MKKLESRDFSLKSSFENEGTVVDKRLNNNKNKLNLFPLLC